jgi:histidinol-phosphate aminotransferase
VNMKPQLQHLKPYQPGKSIEEVKKEYGLNKITKLASNENPYGFSPKVKQALSEALDHLEIYPDGWGTQLRTKLSSFLGVEENQIIFGNGSDEVVQIISRAFLTSSKNTVMAHPTFPQYRHNAVIEGAEIREVPLIDGEHDLPGMLKQIDENTAVVWICSPNNPTGTYVNEEKLVSFIRKVPDHVLVVIDEAYFEYVKAADYPNTISLLKQFPNLMILRTFSKAYGLAALRIGYGIANSNIIQALEPAREPFNTNKLAQIAALAALDDQDFVRESVRKNKEGLNQFYQFCHEYGLKYYPSEGNFILIDFQMEGNKVFQYLLERGYIVRSGNALGFPTSVRITIGTKEQNEELIQILKEMMELK